MNRKNKKILYWILGLIASVSSLFAYGQLKPDNSQEISGYTYDTDTLAVHFLNVGNADCILLQYNEHTMLIDSGEKEDGAEICSYLTSQGIEQINTMILTHPDADHIGGAKEVMDYAGVSDKIYMTNYVKDSKTYKKLMTNIKKTGNTVIFPDIGESFSFGPCKVEFLGPADTYSDSNSMSLVCKLTYGETSFLFTGDCSKEAEKDILKNINSSQLKVDVLKVGHHGSKYSTSKSFLEAVRPSYGIISCDVQSEYGHPHDDTMKRLNQANVRVYRTDKNGTIVAQSDGSKIVFYTQTTNQEEAK